MNADSYKIQMLKVPVSDVEASAQFYSEHMGFEVQFVVAEYGWAQLAAGQLSLALYKPGLGGGNGQIGGSLDFHLSLPEPAFESLAARSLEKGILVENMVHTGNDGTTFVDILDPDENIVKVMKRDAP